MRTAPSPVSTYQTDSPTASRGMIALAGAIVYCFCVYGPMAAMSIGAGFVFLLWLIAPRQVLAAEIRTMTRSVLFIPSVVLSLACLWSLAWAQITDLEFLGMKPPIDWAKDSAKLWHVFFPFILAALLSRLSNGQLRKVAKAWLLVGFLAAFMGVVQHYVPLYKPLELPDRGLRGTFHATGMTGFHLSFAAILGFPLAAWFSVMAAFVKRKKLSKNSMLSFAALISGLTVFLVASIFTFSKINWVAVPVAIVFLALIGLRGKVRWAFLTFLVVAGIAFSMSETVASRFTGLRTINDRLILWDANWAMIREFPVFGVGWHHNSELTSAFYEKFGFKTYYAMWGAKSFSSHAHNNIIDQWATTGTVGLLAFLWWNFVAIILAFKIYRQKEEGRLLFRSLGLGFVGGWICLHINGMTQTNFWDAKVMHQISWVTAMTLELYRRSRLPAGELKE